MVLSKNSTTIIEPTQLMTLAEVAQYLKLTERTVLNMVHRKEIPAVKIASQWRFLKEVIDNWLLSLLNQYNSENLGGETAADYIPADRLLKVENVILDIKPAPKKVVLQTLLTPLTASGLLKNPQQYLSQLVHRENIISTALGHAVAFPHVRDLAINPPGTNMLVAGICRAGTDFAAPDHSLTHLFFLICCANEIAHIRVISRLSHIFRDSGTGSKFIKASDPQEFINIFIEENQKMNYQL